MKKPKHEKKNWKKRISKQNQKGESKKKKPKTRNHFSRHRKNMENKCKNMSNKKKGNRQNRVFWKQKKTEKGSFAEVYKDSKYAKKAIDTEKQRDNQRTRKF